MSMHAIPTDPIAMTITPECASDWLENRNLPLNRTLSETIAKRYADTMRAGRWLLTHQGIAFDKDGFVIDGQHRLRAIVLAGVPVELFVIPNCDPATFAVLDSGHKRQAAHLLHHPYAKTIASAARYLGVVTGAIPSSTAVQGGVYASTMDTDLVLRIVEDWPELIDLAKDVTACGTHSKVTGPPHLAVVAQAARTRHQHLIAPWLQGVTFGAELAPTDTRLHLRNRFARDHRALSHQKQLGYNLIVKAWNGYTAGRQLTLLKVVEAEGVLTVAR